MTASRRCPQCDAEIPPSSPVGLCPRCLLLAAQESQSVDVSGPGPTKISPPNSGFLPPTVEELTPLFPQLEILELLGKGGMGAVYKARQPGLDRLVAVKILPPEISHDPKFTERFQREARALAKLSHPHIVAVYDFGQTGGLCYIVMEFIDGANLRQALRAGTLTSVEALAIVPQICEALQFAHDEGVVHRDIKPENVLLDRRGRVKIADFGLAKLLGNEATDHLLTGTHQVMGTLRYMAPEQMQGSRTVDHRADIYSLGVVFYELLTGELPMGKFALPSKKVQIDVRLDEVVLRTLEQEPEQRYQHASDVKADIESISQSAPVSPIGNPSHRSSLTRDEQTPVPTGVVRTVSPQIRRQLLGPAITLMLYALALIFPIVLCFFNGLDIADGNDSTPAPVGFALITLSFLLLGVAGLAMRGAWHLLAVENHRAAVLGSVLAQPVGLWGLFVLSRPDIKSAFETVPLPPTDEPRLSRPALWGALWAGTGLLACLLIAVSSVSDGPGGGTTLAEGAALGSAPLPVWILIIIIPLVVIAVSAPLGTTILGAVAITQIKRSNGKFNGLPLAQADVLIFPLVLLAVIAGLAGTYIVLLLFKGSGMDDSDQQVLMALVAVVIWFFAARGLWRYVVDDKPAADRTVSPLGGSAWGTPLTQLRFTIGDSQDVARRTVFHFSTLGYQLVEQQTDVCIFQRGKKWAGLWDTDIRLLHTRLTVRTTPASEGELWVSCDWSVRTFGAWVTRRDIAKLEAEGRGLETLLSGRTASDDSHGSTPGSIDPLAPDAPAEPSPRPKLVPVIAAMNLMSAIFLVLGFAMKQTPPFAESVPRIWQMWEKVDVMLGLTLAAGLFAASIGLFLWKPWARKVTLAVCVFGMASFVFDAPYLARFILPDFYAEIRHSLAAEGVDSDLLDLTAMSTVIGFAVVPLVFGLIWLIGQLIYFTRPRVAAAFASSNEDPNRFLEWLFSGAGAVVGMLSVFGPLLLLLGLTALFNNTPTTSTTIPTNSVPPLGTITSGIGAEFTVPAGQVATLEVVTRRDNETVAVPPHCGYVMAPPDRDVSGSFRWTRQPLDATDKGRQSWSLEILTAGGGRGYTEATLLPEELNAAVGAMSLGLGLLESNVEVIHWGTADANNLPANGLIGLRVTVVAHGMQSSGSGNAHLDWRKAQTTQSTSRRKLPDGAP